MKKGQYVAGADPGFPNTTGGAKDYDPLWPGSRAREIRALEALGF